MELAAVGSGSKSIDSIRQRVVALFIGLELGALSHSLSDWGGSLTNASKA